MKIVVTGAGGQLGREWVRYLDENEFDYAAFSSALLDITRTDDVAALLETEMPDVVINCAAYTGVDAAETDKEQAFLVNETGVKNLADVCGRIGSKLVHFSTDYVFPGRAADGQLYPGGYPEDTTPEPINVYGKSKRAGEIALENSRAGWLMIRVSWLCGRYGSNFVKTMLRLGKEKGRVRVVDDQFGSPTFAFDLVEKTARLINMEASGTFHLSCRGVICWADFAEEIFKQAGLSAEVERIPSEQFPQQAKRPDFSYLSTRKVETLIPETTGWQTGLKTLLSQIAETENDKNV